MSEEQETELKFTCTREDLPSVKASPLLRQAFDRKAPQRIVSTYFDTRDKYLWKKRVSLRIRKMGEKRLQTLKQETPSPSERGEWENETPFEAPDFNLLKRTPLASTFKKKKLRKGLRPRFEIDVERRSGTAGNQSSKIEAAIDEGTILADGRRLDLDEVELELKGGSKLKLFDFARELSRELPLSLSLISKAERGFLFSEGLEKHPAAATLPNLFKGMRCEDAFAAICHVCLHDFMLNAEALETAEGVEAVHKGRVAIRRLRAGLRLFKPLVCDDKYKALDDELKWLSHLFGGARDLDVFQEKTFLPAAQRAELPGAPRLADFTGKKRDDAHAALNSALKSERARTLMIDLLSWIENGSWRQSQAIANAGTISQFARKRLSKKLKKLMKEGEDLETIDPEERHTTRIRAKKLRYMASFFENLPGVTKSTPIARLLNCLETVQENLGELHDGEARAEFLETEIDNIFNSGGHAAVFAAGALSQSVSGREENHLKKAASAFASIARMKPF